ncbi:hypothetical protein ABKV19_009052 [Rosa sericea]
MDSNFSVAIATSTPSSIFEDPQIRSILLRSELEDDVSDGDISVTDHTDLALAEPDRLGKDIAHPAKPDISAAAASLNPKLAALSLGNKGIKSKEPKATGVSDKNNKKVAAVASSTSVVTERGGCQICGHDHRHIRCPYLELVPPGGTVGPDYLVVCGECGYELKQPIPACCWSCGYWGGRAVEASTFDYSFRYYLDECYIEEPVTAEYMDPDKYTEQKPVIYAGM